MVAIRDKRRRPTYNTLLQKTLDCPVKSSTGVQNPWLCHKNILESTLSYSHRIAQCILFVRVLGVATKATSLYTAVTRLALLVHVVIALSSIPLETKVLE